MKKILFLLACLLIGGRSNVNAQSIESADIPKFKNLELIPLGESKDVIYFYGNEIRRDLIKFTVYKFKKTSLELIETKEIVISDFKPKVYNANCSMSASYKNNKFYFFYSFDYQGTIYFNLKICDANFNEIKIAELTTNKINSKSSASNNITYSADDKTALFAIKTTTYTTARAEYDAYYYVPDIENTEVFCYDLISDKMLFTKKIPVEMEELNLITKNYTIDNDGNINFIASISETKSGNTIKAIGIGTIKKAEEKIKINEIDISKSSSINCNLWQLKNGDIICSSAFEDNINIKLISSSGDKSKSFDKSIPILNFRDTHRKFNITNVSESDNGYYITMREVRTYNDYRVYAVVYIDKQGNLIFNKTLPLITPIFDYAMQYDSYMRGTIHEEKAGIISKVIDNKLHVFYLENKPYDYNDEKYRVQVDQKMITNAKINEFNTVESIIDETGSIKKNIINDNEIYGLNPLESRVLNTNEEASLYFLMNFKKKIKIKGVTLK